MNDKDYLAACYREGAQRASRLAERMLQKGAVTNSAFCWIQEGRL